MWKVRSRKDRQSKRDIQTRMSVCAQRFCCKSSFRIARKLQSCSITVVVVARCRQTDRAYRRKLSVLPFENREGVQALGWVNSEWDERALEQGIDYWKWRECSPPSAFSINVSQARECRKRRQRMGITGENELRFREVSMIHSGF